MKCLHTLLFAVLISAASAFAAHPGAQPGTRPSTSPAATPAAPQPASATAVEDPDYVIGPGDTIQVFVWQEPELSVTVPVRTDGKVTTPLVEDITAVGLTSSALARAMEERLAKYIRSPQVNIMVTSAQSLRSKVTVLGQVANPGTVPYRNGLTAFDAVMDVGGLTEYAAANRSEIVRKDASGKETRIRIRLADLIDKARMKENVDLQPDDVLLVPKSRF